MVVVFIAGFFIDFIEIVSIIVPVVTPVFIAYGTDLIWLGILLGINLQTSFSLRHLGSHRRPQGGGSPGSDHRASLPGHRSLPGDPGGLIGHGDLFP